MRKVLIMGAAGRDFHNFNVWFRGNKEYRVVAFTASQIPHIEKRRYPASLAGGLYPEGIPIHPEKNLAKLIRAHQIDEVILAYSDLSYQKVMHCAAIANAEGADFKLMGPSSTMLNAKKPVVAVCAVRTGCGKSSTSLRVFELLKKHGRVSVIRHPMPYGDLEKQICQRFASYEDLDRYECTIEEREEYEPYLDRGGVVYAGVDYEKILREAEKESDFLIWDGGNNDFPFIRPTIYITVVDPHRPGDEVSYYPGEMNLRMADVVIVNKIDTARKEDVERVIENVKRINHTATIIKARSPISLDKPELVKGKDALVVEDGPTLTHGDMSYGAGYLKARELEARIIDPRKYATGSLKEIYAQYPQIGKVLPAMGYNREQIKELEETIACAKCDAVVIATPINLRDVIKINKPTARITYELEVVEGSLEEILSKIIK